MQGSTIGTSSASSAVPSPGWPPAPLSPTIATRPLTSRWLLEDARGAPTPLGALFVAHWPSWGVHRRSRAATAEVVVALLATRCTRHHRDRFSGPAYPEPVVVALAVGALQMLWLGRPPPPSAALGLLVGAASLRCWPLRRGAMVPATSSWRPPWAGWWLSPRPNGPLLGHHCRRRGRTRAAHHSAAPGGRTPWPTAVPILGGWLLHLAMLGLLPWGA